ncbi:MAG: molybdopterin molybdotransferase MoeA [Leptonema sp. (in: bacteria)]
MISIEEAIQTIKNNIPEPKLELRKTYDCVDYYLAQDVYSNLDSPYFDNSAMDGFAISLEDVEELLQNSKEIVLDMIGTSKAGSPFDSFISKNQCVQINTGAKIPINTGAIVPIENVEFLDSEKTKIKIKQIKKKFQNIRKKGEEIQKGQVLFNKNTCLNVNQISFLLQNNISEIFVYKKPKVLLITTGSELVSYKETLTEEDLQNGRIINTNSFTISYFLDKFRIEHYKALDIKDEEKAIYKVIEKYYDEVDIIIITGGVSVGPYDYVKQDVENFGFIPLFWKINQKPGKPFYFAKKENKLLFGLPGNPVSSYISFYHYVLPAIRFFDSRIWFENKIQLKSEEEIINKGDRDTFYTIKRIGENRFILYKQQGSYMLSSLAYTEGYILVRVNQTIQKEEKTDCYLWI